MIAFILSLILFVLTIPLKTVALTYKVVKKTYEVKKEVDSKVKGTKKRDTALSRVVQNRSKKRRGKKGSSNIGKAVAEKIFKVLKTLVSVVRFVALLLAFISSLISMLMMSALFSLLTSVAMVVLVFDNGDLNFDSLKDKITTTQIQDLQYNNGSIDSDLLRNDGSMVGCIKAMADFYMLEVGTYNQSLFVPCENVGFDVRADCSGFASAVVRLNTGNYPNANLSSSSFCSASTHERLRQVGFEIYESSELGAEDLQAGDLLATIGHVQFYLSEKTSFGWGSVKTAYPSSYSCYKGSDGNFHDKVGHVYTYVIRKVGS